MKTVKLTDFECEVIYAALVERKICETMCFCNYKKITCDELKADGTYRCKLQQAIQSIEDKLCGEERK